MTYMDSPSSTDMFTPLKRQLLNGLQTPSHIIYCALGNPPALHLPTVSLLPLPTVSLSVVNIYPSKTSPL